MTSTADSVLARAHRMARDLGDTFQRLSLYESFEHAVVLVLTLLIVLIVGSATWRLAIAVFDLMVADAFDPANQKVFQSVFGMIFTVIIALEFKHSLLIALSQQESVVRVRSIILIAMLAMVRKFIILDLTSASAAEILALAAAILHSASSIGSCAIKTAALRDKRTPSLHFPNGMTGSRARRSPHAA